MFAKVFQQIYDSSIAHDYSVRRMFMDMLVLADVSGVVDMTYEAIARRTGVPINEVVTCIGRLMESDPASRSGKMKGARLAFIDSGRDWGWQIVNYERYRKIRDEEGRRSYNRNYMRPYMRKKRAADKLNKQESNKINDTVSRSMLDKLDRNSSQVTGNNRQQPIVKQRLSKTVRFPSQIVRHSLDKLDSVKPCLTQGEGEGEGEEDKNKPPTVPQGGLNGEFGFDAAKEFLNSVFGRDKRKWSREEDGLLADIVPIQSHYAELIRAWFSLPADHPVFDPKLTPHTLRKQELTTFLRDYNGELDKMLRFAPLFVQSGNGSERKKEPPQWREFFRWKYPEARIPNSWEDLEPDQRAEYERDFATFQAALDSQEKAVA